MSNDSILILNQKMPFGCISLNKVDSEVVLYVQKAQENLE